MWPLIVPVHRLAPFPGRQDNRKGLGSKEGRMFKDTSPAPPETMVRVSPAAARTRTMARMNSGQGPWVHGAAPLARVGLSGHHPPAMGAVPGVERQ